MHCVFSQNIKYYKNKTFPFTSCSPFYTHKEYLTTTDLGAGPGKSVFWFKYSSIIESGIKIYFGLGALSCREIIDLRHKQVSVL